MDTAAEIEKAEKRAMLGGFNKKGEKEKRLAPALAWHDICNHKACLRAATVEEIEYYQAETDDWVDGSEPLCVFVSPGPCGELDRVLFQLPSDPLRKASNNKKCAELLHYMAIEGLIKGLWISDPRSQEEIDEARASRDKRRSRRG